MLLMTYVAQQCKNNLLLSFHDNSLNICYYWQQHVAQQYWGIILLCFYGNNGSANAQKCNTRTLYVSKNKLMWNSNMEGYDYFQLRTAAFKAYCAILVRRSNFPHQASPRKSTQRRKVELRARNVREFCLNADPHVTFRDLLHAIKLWHGTDGFTSPPKEGVLRIFSP